jgi:hypothetical protein
MSDMPLPYERQPGETAKAFAAFTCFRDLGPERSVLKAYQQKTGKKHAKQATGVWNGWATAYNWHERAAAWDSHLDRQTREAQERARREMGERHAKIAVALQEKAIQRLKAMKLEEMSPSDALRFTTESIKLERLARGEPESIGEQRHGGTAASPIRLLLEDVVAEDKRLEEHQDGPVQPDGGQAVRESDP